MSAEREEKMSHVSKLQIFFYNALHLLVCKLHENLQAMHWKLQFLQTSYKIDSTEHVRLQLQKVSQYNLHVKMYMKHQSST